MASLNIARLVKVRQIYHVSHLSESKAPFPQAAILSFLSQYFGQFRRLRVSHSHGLAPMSDKAESVI